MKTNETCKEYLGYKYDEVMQSRQDILGLNLLRNGIPVFSEMKGILPPVVKGSYIFLSGRSSWHGLIVSTNGTVYPQETALNSSPLPLFSPHEVENDIDKADIVQWILKGWIPIVTTRYTMVKRIIEITMFVEFCDPDSSPQLWIRVNYASSSRHFLVSNSRPIRKRRIVAREFNEALNTTIASWEKYGDMYHNIDVPYPEINVSILAMITNIFTTFSGDHAHYGHKYYGREIHDFFPPNYLSGIELCMTLGMREQAEGMITHLLRYGIDIKGRFCYRQGLKDMYGASGSEYGRLFWLILRLHHCFPDIPLECYITTLLSMGKYYISQIHEYDNMTSLIIMCAEADTRSRINAYTSNNLWAVIGLNSLGDLLAEFDQSTTILFKKAAQSLYKDIRDILNKEKINSEYGPLVPFQIGYSPIPLTLSSCKMSVEDKKTNLDDYYDRIDFDDKIKENQNYSENTYANYRYFAEMLSTGLLMAEEAEAINTLRANSGGEILGMTRFFERIDDWPADQYARYYMDTDKLDKYLLLYYSHFLYHGNPHTGVYYEQVTPQGSVFAPDCIPSMTLIPLMTAWLFCYQPVNERSIYLLRGIPSDWLEGNIPFHANNLCSEVGSFSIGIIPKESILHIDILVKHPCANFKTYSLFLDIHLSEEIRDSNIEASGIKLMNTSIKNRYCIQFEREEASINVTR